MSLSLQLIQGARLLLVRACAQADSLSTSITRPELALLLTIHEYPGSTAADLAASLGRDKTTLSRSIASLGDRGLICTELDSIDGRRKNLYLTNDARLLLQPTLASIQNDIESATANLSTEDVEMLRNTLAKLIRLEL